MRTYSEHTPTVCDQHIELEGREHWLIVPVSITRDTPAADQSNFYTALGMLGGESDTVELHRFGHWGPGWYEIIIVNPESPGAAIVEDIARSLADYPLLDDEDYSRREYDDAIESWASYGYRDYRDDLHGELETTLAEYRDADPPALDFCQHSGISVMVCGCGECHGFGPEIERIERAIDTLDDLAPEQLWTLEMDPPEYHTDSEGITFRPRRSRDTSNAFDLVERIEAAAEVE